MGDVNDLVIKPTGEIEAVVVGVGGFIGIGEKNVAIALNRFTMEPTEDLASTKLVLNATKEELEAAPAFKSAYVQKLDEEYQQQSALLQFSNIRKRTSIQPCLLRRSDGTLWSRCE